MLGKQLHLNELDAIFDSGGLNKAGSTKGASDGGGRGLCAAEFRFPTNSSVANQFVAHTERHRVQPFRSLKIR